MGKLGIHTVYMGGAGQTSSEEEEKDVCLTWTYSNTLGHANTARAVVHGKETACIGCRTIYVRVLIWRIGRAYEYMCLAVYVSFRDIA